VALDQVDHSMVAREHAADSTLPFTNWRTPPSEW
jgi:hypothetical protein